MSRFFLLLSICAIQFHLFKTNKVTHQLTFPVYEVDPYAKLDGTIRQVLTQYTLCYWSQQSGVLPHHVPRAFVYLANHPSIRRDIDTGVGDKVHFTRQIGGDYIYTSIPHGSHKEVWIHVCFTWALMAPATKWKLFINGNVIKYGTSTDLEPIYPNGTVILGKLIEDPEDEFSQKNPYKGRLSEIQMWDYILTSDEVSEVYKCSFKNEEGNIISWKRDNWVLFGGTRISQVQLPCRRR